MTMPMTGVRGGERLHNDDRRLARRRPVGVLRSPVENRPFRRSDQIIGCFAAQSVPVCAGIKPIDGFCFGPDLGTVRLGTNYQQGEIRGFTVLAHPTTE